MGGIGGITDLFRRSGVDRLVVLDVETTGLGRADRIVELAMLAEYSQLVEARGGPGDLLSVLGSDAEAAAVDLDVRRSRELPRDVLRDGER